MNLSAVYICPVRGLVGLEPPEPETAYQAARTARDVGLTRLELPLPEEALDRPRQGLAYLDGLVKVLDAVAEADLVVELVPLPRKLLGLRLGSRHLYKPGQTPDREPVFLENKIRHLRPLNWWSDPGLVSRHVKLVREAAAALGGHPALESWLLLDRHWSGLEVEPRQIDWLLQALSEEIRSRDEGVGLRAGLAWPELVNEDLVATLAHRTDGLRLAGLESPAAWAGLEAPADELALAAYLNLIGRWLTGSEIVVETGWTFGAAQARGANRTKGHFTGLERLAAHLTGPLALCWTNLAVPRPDRSFEPPWLGDSRLTGLGLLDHTLEPFDWLEPLTALKDADQAEPGFIDLDRAEFLADPNLHLERLFSHWLASLD